MAAVLGLLYIFVLCTDIFYNYELIVSKNFSHLILLNLPVHLPNKTSDSMNLGCSSLAAEVSRAKGRAKEKSSKDTYIFQATKPGLRVGRQPLLN